MCDAKVVITDPSGTTHRHLGSPWNKSVLVIQELT
jgi:hypothetical protein